MSRPEHRLSLIIPLLIIILSGAGTPVGARKITTKFRPPAGQESDSCSNVKTVTRDSTDANSHIISSVTLSGYNKPAASARETLFLTNASDRTLTSIALTISYRTMQGIEIHRRSVAIDCMVPPGQTRLAEYPSWDRQHTFYYYRSERPRKKATPYEVAIDIDSLTVR